MNSGRGLTGVLDPGLMAPIPDKVTGPRCRARRGGTSAGSLTSSGPREETAGRLGSSLGQAGMSGGPESRQLGRAQKIIGGWAGLIPERAGFRPILSRGEKNPFLFKSFHNLPPNFELNSNLNFDDFYSQNTI
jgi:hypothetical protein